MTCATGIAPIDPNGTWTSQKNTSVNVKFRLPDGTNHTVYCAQRDYGVLSRGLSHQVPVLDNSGQVCHPSTAKVMRKLKDGSKRNADIADVKLGDEVTGRPCTTQICTTQHCPEAHLLRSRCAPPHAVWPRVTTMHAVRGGSYCTCKRNLMGVHHILPNITLCIHGRAPHSILSRAH